MQFLTGLIEHYGYIILFLSLMLELIALPMPGEFLMGYAGVLVYQGKLNWILSMLIAGLGSSAGMTLSYWIGYKLGSPFFHKYGHRIHMGPDRIEKLSNWFGRFGNKLILIAFYIPGVRHFTGYFSGITRISFRAYAIFAYIGAFIWTGTFITLGKVLGPQWEQFHTSLKKYLFAFSIIFIILLVIIYVLKKYRGNIKEWILGALSRGVQRTHSIRRTKFFIVTMAFFLLVFIISITSLSEDYLHNEFNRFDTIGITLVMKIFDERFTPWMSFLGFFASVKVTIPLVIFCFVWILVKSKERLLDLLFLILVVIGGEFFEEGIRRIFHHLHPVANAISNQNLYLFPSEQTMTAFIIFGFIGYIFARYIKHRFLDVFVILISIMLVILIGLSRIYFMQQHPSDVVAGYAFGGVWLSLNILVLEIFRLSRKGEFN
ncbi:VTT domain-containing protein [Rummeliibacillus sp. JY-2-4R]